MRKGIKFGRPVGKHGMSKTAEHRIWRAIRQRCENPKAECFNRYGGRGIKICARWGSFENFYADMGPRPTSKHSIDRIDANGNYEPRNCRWATPLEQGRNSRTTKVWRIAGIEYPSAYAAAKALGVHQSTISRRCTGRAGKRKRHPKDGHGASLRYTP